MRVRIAVIAVRGERLALTRLEAGTADASPGAPYDEILQLFGLDENGRIALQVSFDVEDIDAALAELDTAHARFEDQQPRGAATGKRGEPSRSSAYMACFAVRDWDDFAEMLADDISVEDRRRVVNAGIRQRPRC